MFTAEKLLRDVVMDPHQEYCPNCRQPREMRVTRSRRKVKDESGKTHTVTYKIYHCAVCNTFVRDEQVKKPAAT